MKQVKQRTLYLYITDPVCGGLTLYTVRYVAWAAAGPPSRKSECIWIATYRFWDRFWTAVAACE